ncbi:hypothetical protein IJ090_01475 [Candidatus Saccharibacteria bacterium]|nr:hypothetical protein [Candidatus Saccharibacteria bacterium]
MKKIHKRLLGVGGLALVAAITTVAYHIPDAGAVSYSANVDVNVSVVSQNPEVIINSPLDGAKLTNPNLNIKVRYGDAESITYTLIKGDQSVVIPSPALSGNATEIYGNSGEHNFYYNLKEFNPSTAGYGSYTLNVTVNGKNSSSVEDSVSFTYTPASVDDGSIPVDENNNPIVDLNVKESVIKVEAIVLNSDGSEAFRTTVDTNGESPVYMTLPFSSNNSESGTYTVKFITYSYNGLGQLVADQDEATTNLKTQVTYTKKVVPDDAFPPDDTPATPQNPEAGDENNPEVPAPAGTEEGEIVHVVVTDPTTGEVVLEVDLPANADGTVTIPFGDYNLPEGDYQVTVTPYTEDPITGEPVLDPSKATSSNTEYEGKTEENQITVNPETGNPVVSITNDGSVVKAKVIIEDKDGNKIEVPIDIAPGQTEINIPFESLGLPAGDYKVTVITYSRDPETGKLVPNQDIKYVKPYNVAYDGSGVLPYRFIDENNENDTHNWDRYANAGKDLFFRIPTFDTYRYFDPNDVYVTTLGNEANLFNAGNRLNRIYFKDSNGSLNLYLLSSYLATLKNGNYVLGVILDNGERPTVDFEITGELKGECTETPNPVIDIEVEEGVVKVEIIVYDKNMKEVFRFEAPVTSITTNHITLPLSNYCLGDGDYYYGIIPYILDENGDYVPLITEDEAKQNAIKFTYGNPEVPNTGSFLSALNLSQKDFLLTGLIVFTVVTAGGIFILRKQESRR